MNFAYKETALNAKQLEAFIKVLYGATGALATDQVNKPVAQSIGGWASSARAVEKALGIAILDDLVQIAKTAQVDEDELLPKIKMLRRAIRQVVKTDTSVDHGELEMLQTLTAYIAARSDSALNKAIKMLPALNEPSLTENFTFEANSQKDFVKPLEKIVFAATKVKGRSALTADEAKAVKAKSPAVYKEYLRLRKAFNQVWKDELRNFVFQSKKKAVDFKTAVKHLDGLGVQHMLPKGFEGFVDSNGAIYTKAGKAISGLPGPGFSIQMNPEYDPKADNSYVFTTVNDATGDRSQHVYTMSYRKQATQQKFEKVKNLDKVIDGVRKKWVQQMRKNDTSLGTVAATILELLYQFSARVGSMGNSAGGEQTFGISTLQGKHFKIDGDKILIAYQGKDNVRQVHKLQATTPEAKMLVNNLKLYLADKGPKDRVFVFSGKTGKARPMTGGLVNKVFKTLGSPVTVHKLRHVRGSRLFSELLAQNEKKIFGGKTKPSETQAVQIFKKLATKVGEMLGHVRGVGQQQKITPGTAIQNYIDPGVMVSFFDRLGYRTPKFLSKFKKEA